MNVFFLNTPVGTLQIEYDNFCVSKIAIVETVSVCTLADDFQRLVTTQFDEYFAGARKIFDFKIAFCGTAFQNCVWSELLKIPYGDTISYGELARRIDNPNASRAVGNANSKNPLPFVIPCHRVVAINGVGGYSGGVKIKEFLLNLESKFK